MSVVLARSRPLRRGLALALASAIQAVAFGAFTLAAGCAAEPPPPPGAQGLAQLAEPGGAPGAARADCAGEVVRHVAKLAWAELRDPDADDVVERDRLTLQVEGLRDRPVDATLTATFRVDGEPIAVELGRVRLRGAERASIPVDLRVPGRGLGALEHPVQVAVQAVLRDEAGALLGSTSVPPLYMHAAAGGRALAYTEKAMRTRFASGALRRGLDAFQRAHDVVATGRARRAQPSDLRGDPLDAAPTHLHGEDR